MDQPTPDTPSAQPLPNKEIQALIDKHRPEIDRIKMMNNEGQQQAFRELGVDPKALEDHYAELQQRSVDLRKRDIAANKKVAISGWGSFAAGLAGSIAATHIKAPASKLVRWFTVAFATVSTALAGSFIASRVFAGKIRTESRQLDRDAKNAFERELAVALENRERDGGKPAEPAAPTPAVEVAKSAAAAPAPASVETAAAAPVKPEPAQAAPAQPEPAQPESAPVASATGAVNVPKRDASFAAQAAAEKAATVTINIHL